MRISAVDKGNLHKLASKATYGDWCLTVHSASPAHFNPATDDWTIHIGGIKVIASETGIRNADDVRFMAAASPAVILDLLDEIKRLETGNLSSYFQDDTRPVPDVTNDAGAPVDKLSLRKLAHQTNRVSPGIWRAGNVYGKPFIPGYQVMVDGPDGPAVILEGNQNFVEAAKVNAAWAAAVCPTTVLALLDEIEALRSCLVETAGVAITMLYESHKADTLKEFSVAELEQVVSATKHLSDAEAPVEKVYRKAWDAGQGGAGHG